MRLPTEEQLLKIAQTHLDSTLKTLDARSSDSLDFHDVAVWGIKGALLAAYNLGWEMRDWQED